MKAWKKGIFKILDYPGAIFGATFGIYSGGISIPIGLTHYPTPPPSYHFPSFSSIVIATLFFHIFFDRIFKYRPSILGYISKAIGLFTIFISFLLMWITFGSFTHSGVVVSERDAVQISIIAVFLSSLLVNWKLWRKVPLV